MDGYKTIVACLDGSEQQDIVLERAIGVAERNKAKLIVAHAIDSTALEAAGAYPVDLIEGLKEVKTPEEVSKLRGRSVEEILG